ncbi:hypothetical protein PROFUN_01455 [Planoprotostelium fungivorum]|uniref:PH domain-containing protein n=1 Tax=Planoprotostelium fungivorum TaxID=1890364 RepID=A0A2P6NTA0_9EUKA|nr:hypothetical protein PROFUN_01455 [Planoprotostelium fungivorum]
MVRSTRSELLAPRNIKLKLNHVTETGREVEPDAEPSMFIEWDRYEDDEGNVYFHNSQSGETLWEHSEETCLTSSSTIETETSSVTIQFSISVPIQFASFVHTVTDFVNVLYELFSRVIAIFIRDPTRICPDQQSATHPPKAITISCTSVTLLVDLRINIGKSTIHRIPFDICPAIMFPETYPQSKRRNYLKDNHRHHIHHNINLNRCNDKSSPKIDAIHTSSPKEFKPDLAWKKWGGDVSIGLPTGVVRTGSFKGGNFGWVEGADLSMRGYLHHERAGHWMKFYCIVQDGKLTMFKSDGDQQLVDLNFVLKDSEYDVPTKEQRPNEFSIQLFNASKYKFHATSPKEMSDWAAAIKINGAIDGVLAREEREKMKKQESAAYKREEKEYTQQKVEMIKTRANTPSTPPSPSMTGSNNEVVKEEMKIQLEDCNQSPNGPTFKMKITFGNQEWYIYRTDKEISALYNALVTSMFSVLRLDHLKGKCPKYKTLQEMKANLSQYSQLLYDIDAERIRIFGEKNARMNWVRFFAPLKYGDVKPPGFVLPFVIELS